MIFAIIISGDQPLKNKSDDTIRRTYQKVSPNFPPEIEERLHEIVKNSTISDIVDYAEICLPPVVIGEFKLDKKAMKNELKNPDKISILTLIALGSYIYNQLGDKILKEYFLTNNIRVQPNRINWKFIMKSFSRQILKNGQKIYYSIKTPALKIDDKLFRLAYTSHCLERIHQRAAGGRYKYGALCDYFYNIKHNTYFEMVTLPNESLAISIYEKCLEGFSSFDIVKEIFGNNYYPDDKYFYRLGYLPIERFNEFAVAKTLLCPGYSETPEFKLLKESEENSEWLKRAYENEQSCSRYTYDLALTKKYHQLGIPQVKTFEKDIFKYS
jgi:hypothetical protein